MNNSTLHYMSFYLVCRCDLWMKRSTILYCDALLQLLHLNSTIQIQHSTYESMHPYTHADVHTHPHARARTHSLPKQLLASLSPQYVLPPM